MTLLGRYLDGKLTQHHDDGTPKYRLESLLADPARPEAGQAAPARRFQNPQTLMRGGVYEL